MNELSLPKNTAISTLGSVYEKTGAPALVAVLTAIDPSFGFAAAIGSLLSYGNSQRSKVKTGYVAQKVAEQLQSCENSINKINENLHEAINLAMQGIESSVTINKLDRFARIISGHIIYSHSWDETATALRAISSLEDIHIEILNQASSNINITDRQARFYIKTPNFPKPGMINGSTTPPTIDILEKLNKRGHTEVRMFCMELMSKGLLHDNDQGKFDQGPVFTLTDAAFWLLAKIELISKR